MDHKPRLSLAADRTRMARIVDTQGDMLKQRFGMSVDLATHVGRQELLEFWLTTPEENYQIVPTTDGEALVADSLSLNKTEVPLPEAKE